MIVNEHDDRSPFDNVQSGATLLWLALIAGVAGDYLMRTAPGLNVLTWLGLVLALGWYAFRQHEVDLHGEGRWLIVPAVFLAGAFAWRNSPLLLALDLLVLTGTAALAVLKTHKGTLFISGLVDYVLVALAGGVNVVIGPLMLLTADVSWKNMPRTRWSRTTLAIARGLLVAVPLILLFGALFMAADAAYEQLVTNIFDVPLDQVVSHLLGVVCFTWLAAGLLRTALVGREPEWGDLDGATKSIAMGTIEVSTIFGSLDLLFASFVAVQFRYLFGGAALIQAATGQFLTYADYARRGFFELATVAGLVLPLLLVGHWLLRYQDRRGQRWFNALAGLMLVLVSLVMASAFYRMWLYRQQFGLTELRFYVTAFMIWLAVVLGWFAVTVLRGRRTQFMVGVLVSGYLALLVLHALNPDAYIARANLAHYGQTGRFDAGYATMLSADAVPVLTAGFDQIPVDQRKRVAQELLERWGGSQPNDLRAWNWGRVAAWRAVDQNRTLLQEAAGQGH